MPLWQEAAREEGAVTGLGLEGIAAGPPGAAAGCAHAGGALHKIASKAAPGKAWRKMPGKK
jgi:hypothetical protein